MPSETSDQMQLVRKLRERGWAYHHSPNEGKRGKTASGGHSGSAMRARGTTKGFPDLVIYDPVPLGWWEWVERAWANQAGLGFAAGTGPAGLLWHVPSRPDPPGLVMELKGEKEAGHTFGTFERRILSSAVSPEQRVWLRRFQTLGWAVGICYGLADAWAFCQAMGYGEKK